MNSDYKQSAEHILKGLGSGSPRRGPTVLRLIYARVASLISDRHSVTVAPYDGEQISDTRNKAFLGAIASSGGVGKTTECAIQDLERYALDWADLVPQSPAVKADLIKRIGDAFDFEATQIPKISDVLGIADPAVSEAFIQQNGTSIDEIYSDRTGISQKAKWASSRFSSWFENLPAFWASFSLTLASLLGPIVLALPVVFLSFGPVAAAAMILVLGSLNILTLAYLAESQQRAGWILRGFGFNGMIEHYLGPIAGSFLKFCLFSYSLFVLFAYTGGFLGAISDTIGGIEMVWFCGLLAFVLWYLSPKNHGGSLTVAFAVAIINLLILLGFSVAICVAILQADVPAIQVAVEDSQNAIPIQLAIGAVLYAFAGHTSVANGAKLILKRRGSGTGFLQGAVSGFAAITVLYVFWTSAMVYAMRSGVFPQDSSVLDALSSHFGPIALVAATIFVFLTLGIGSGNYAMAAHLVFVDTFIKLRAVSPKLNATGVSFNKQRSAQVGGAIGVGLIAMTMGFAAYAYLQGYIELSRYFGLIGGLMAPIVAGVFPVFLFLACKARGASVKRGASKFLSSFPVIMIALVGFVAVYVVQALSHTEYPIWYRVISGGLVVVVVVLFILLTFQKRFKDGLRVEIVKSNDGWDPKRWRYFRGGELSVDETVRWKTSRNSDYQTIHSSTTPARILTAVELKTRGSTGSNLDVLILDETADKIMNPKSIQKTEDGVIVEI